MESASIRQAAGVTRICQVPDCGASIPRRRGNPAKRCPDHINAGTCETCGAPTSRKAGVTGGRLPRFCGRSCSHRARVAKMTPVQLEDKRRRAREAARVDIHCLDCGVLIPRREGNIRRSLRCALCNKAHHGARKARNLRDKKFRQYGITAETYDKMLAAQGGGCAFCGATRAHPTSDHDFYVDHDHSCCSEKGRSCGRCVRFLLCSRCNVGIGYLLDDPARLRRAADLIETYRIEKGLTRA